MTGPHTDSTRDRDAANSHCATVAEYEVTPECSHQEFLAAAKLYARKVVDEYGLSVTVGDLEWEVSTRAKRRAGAVRHRSGDPLSVSLTWGHFERAGWKQVAATVRHELVHVHLLNEDSDASHGEAFRRLAEKLDAPLRCERFTEPKWWVVCEGCGGRLARYRRSKLVETPESYECGDCGGTLRVERNDG